MRMRKLLCGFLAVCLAGSAAAFAACGGNENIGNRRRIKFIASGEMEEYSTLVSITNEYNDGQGWDDGVWVDISYKPTDGYDQFLLTTYNGTGATDVFYANDRYFKKYVQQGFVQDLDELQASTGITLETDAMYQSGISRYRYDVDTNTSNDDDPLYGIVRDMSPTIIYYNQSAFEKTGIICVSVPESEIDEAYAEAFNAEHNTSFTADHLRRGFVRESVVNNYGGSYQNEAYVWSLPTQQEVMVFNNQIAMSWDEVEDLGKIMTKEKWNSGSPTKYGYYTWWWFYYGFSVGGDCIEDITGEGDWVFTLKDAVPNFIVADGVEGEITVGGNKYAAGELIAYTDRTDLDEETSARILQESSDLTEADLTEEVLRLESENKLVRLPSERDAFCRYVKLAQKKDSSDEYGVGLEISPQPSNVAVTGDTGMFTDGSVAMIVHKSNALLSMQETIQNSPDAFAWNVAPLPIFKEYAGDGTVSRKGVPAGASDSNAYCINSYSSEEKKLAAMKFLKYLSSAEAQTFAAETGFTVPSRPDCVDAYIASGEDLNLKIVADAAVYETPGDWWYMPDKVWIDDYWADDLNNQVRNNKMTLQEFFDRFELTQQYLNKYKKG